MLEQGSLRKADVFSGTLILLLGLFIISQAVQMPMKDSWGGVQNVWFVSPALFPLFVGGMLSFLGLVLVCIAIKSTGKKGLQETFAFLSGHSFKTFLTDVLNIRFYAIVFTLFSYVFLMIPRIDFFPCSILFLLVLFFMFYLGDNKQLLKIFAFTIVANLILILLLFTALNQSLANFSEFYADWFVMITILALCFFVRIFMVSGPEVKRKYKLCLIIGFLAPAVIGIIFKYFLLVPMPFEGLIIQVLDAIWYADFWS